MLFLHLQICIFNLHRGTTLENVFSGSCNNLDGACTSTKIYFPMSLYKLTHKISRFSRKKVFIHQKMNLSATTVKGVWCTGWNCPYHYACVVFQTPRNIFKQEEVKQQWSIIWILISISWNLNPLTVLFIFNWISYRKVIIAKPDLFSNICSFSLFICHVFFWLGCFVSAFYMLRFCFS